MFFSKFSCAFISLLSVGSTLAMPAVVTPSMAGLTDYEQIQQKLNLYGIIVDSKDFDRFHELFTDDVKTTSVNGNFSGYGPVTKNIAQFVTKFTTQHLIGTSQVNIAKDKQSANVFSYAQATFWLKPQQNSGQVVYLSAQYTDHFVKTSDGWKINLRNLADSGPAAGNLTILG